MARLRFPGRPGKRFGRKYIKYTYDDLKLQSEKFTKESCENSASIGSFNQRRFTIQDQKRNSSNGDHVQGVKVTSVPKSKSVSFAIKNKKFNSFKKNRTTKNQKLATVFESRKLTYSNYYKKNKLQDLLSKSVTKLLTDSLCQHFKSGFIAGKENCRSSMSFKKQPPDTKVNSSVLCLGDSNANSEQCESRLNINDSCSSEKVENLPVCREPTACTDPKRDFKSSVETMIMKRLLQKAKQSYDSQAKTHQEQNRTGRSVKKKLRRRYKSSKRKSKDSSKDEMSECDDSFRTKSSSKPLLPAADSSHLQPLSIEVGNLKVLNQNSPLINDIQPTSLKRHSMVLGRKKFTLPIVSARSSRRIFPQKRYLQEEDLDVPPKRNSSANSGKCTLPSNSAASKGNHTVNSNPSKKGNRGHSVPAPNQLLLTEGKRHWKSSAKLDLSQKSSPLNLQKNCSDGVLRNSVCSASSSEFIKPDMVSKYADKMAEKPKERRLKNGDGRKSFVQKPDETVIVKEEKWNVPEKRAIDPLERIAAKIEKILRSQWEGRLNQTTNTVPPPPPPVIKSESPQTMKVKTSPLSQWKSEQEQRACDRKRTKNLIRKARLQLKKRTLMKLRQPQSIALLNEQLQTSKTGAFSDKPQALCSPTSLEWKNAPPIELKKSPVPKFNVPGTKACCVCDLSATISQVQKYYGQLACDACSKFFGNFIETPKQYFCPKEGNCSSSAKTVRNAKASNSRFRCRACWLKACMLNFSVSAFLREQLLKYVPRLEAPPHDALLDDNNALSRMVNLVDFAPSSSKVAKDLEVSKNNVSILEVCSEQTNQSSQNFGPLVSGGKSIDSALKGSEAFKTQESPNQDSSSVLMLDSSHDATNSTKSMESTEQTSICGKIRDQVPLSAEEDNERISTMSNTLLSDENFVNTRDNASAATTDGAALLLSKADNISNVPLSTLGEINVPLCEGRKTAIPSSPTDEPKSYAQLEVMAPLPAADDNANSSYNAEEDEATLPQMEEVKAILLKATGNKPRGPRIKHVCRRAAVVLGLPKATFTQPSSPKKHFNLSALPQEEKQKLLATETDTSKTEPKPSKLTKSCTTVTTEASKMKVSIGIAKKTSLTIKKKQKKKKLLLKKSFKRFRKHSFKKPMELTRKLLIKNQLKYSYKQRLTKTSTVPLKLPAKCVSKVPKFRKVRCKQCKGCLADDCGRCSYCLDKKKFGGPNLIKQACMHRRCLKPMMPASEKKMVAAAAAAAANKCNEEPTSSSFDHMNADSRSEDSVLGISPSLLNSSCSPSLSPDNSSCGSSCSSSSSSSSSGSSSSSSDSNSSSSNDSSHSKHSNSSNNNSSSHCSNIDSIDKDSSELRNDTSEPSFLFETTFNNGFAVDFDAASSQTNFVNSVDLPLNACAVDADDFESSGSSCPGKVPCGRSKKTHGRQPLQEKGKDYVNRSESDGSEDEERDKKHVIVADYWVGRNTEKIFNIGFALITSQPLPLRTVCFLCGSAGEENFIYCVVCCEPYHLFCTGERELPKNIDDWCCPKCQTCTVCGLKLKLLKCNECQNAYHIDCLGSFYPSKPSKKKKIWICPKCVKCKSCGTTTPSPGSSVGWNFDLLLCHGCTRLRDKGNFCPLCHKCYEDDDYDSEMMQCSKCDVWVHAKCERMTDEEYQILSALPETIIYNCFNCTINFPPMWKLAVGNAFDSGLKSVMNTLLNAKCMKHLVSRKTESERLETNCSSNSLLNICPNNRGVESDNQSIHEPELPKVESCLPNGMCDGGLTIETALHKADAFERPFASATNHCLEFSSPISSKSSIIDSGIECDNSEGDMDKNEITQSDQSRNTFITTGISSSCKTNNNNEMLKGSCLTVSATWSSSSHDPSTELSKVKTLDDDSSSQQSCTSVNESVERFRVQNTINKTRKQQELVDLMTIKRKLSCRKYKSVNAFVNDVVTVIDSREADGKKGDELVARSFFSKLIEKAFPWFEIRDSKLWDNDEIHVPNDLLPHAVMPPNDDHMYATYLKPSEPVPFQQLAALKTVQGISMGDLRKCALCGTIGDDNEKEKGRLLYCGQDDWIHLNCALWSAEVFQESDGLLKNVYSAISRGRLMRCESCDKYGATVGCCVRGCPSNFHYLCARKANALFQTDKKVFCEEHKYCNDAPIMKDDDFQVRERIYINQEDIKPKWIKKSWLNGQEVQNTHIVIGSLTVENLGCLTTVSDEKEHLIPVNFVCSRVFWSTKNPSQRVIYTCRTIEVLPEERPVELQGTENLTISHDDTILTEEGNCPLLHQSEQIPSTCRLEGNQLSSCTYLTCNKDSGLVPSPLSIKDTQNKSIKENSKSSYTFQDRKVVGSLLSDILEEISHHPLQNSSSKRSRLPYRTRRSLSTSGVMPKLQCAQNVNSSKSNVNLIDILSDGTRTRNLIKRHPRINGSLKKHDMVSLAVQPHQSLCSDMVSTVLCDSSKNKDDQSEHFEEQLSSTEKTEIPENFRSGPIVTQHTINPDKTKNEITLQQNFVLQNDEETIKENGLRSVKESDKLNPKGYSHFPNKVNGLVDVILPSSPITETVLPVYHVEKHLEVNGHLSCDSVNANEHVSGDSGNGEVSDHESRSLRPTPARLSSFYDNLNHKNSFCIGNTNKRFKCAKLRKLDDKLINSSVNDEYIEVDKKAVFNNGLTDNASLSPDVFANGIIEKTDIDSTTTVMDKVKAYSLHKNGCTKPLTSFIKNSHVVDVCERFSASNGCMQQDLGPFKCGKCKRSYRTKESFEKHISLCDFVIDSSSDDEEEEKLPSSLQQRNSGVISSAKLLHPFEEDGISHSRVNDLHNEEMHLCKDNNSTLPEINTCDTICEPPLVLRSESQGVVSTNNICHSNNKNAAYNLKTTLPCATPATQPFNNKARSSILPSPSADHPELSISSPISLQSNIISSILPPPTSNCVELPIPALLQSDNCSQVSAPIFAETVSVAQALPCNKTLTNQIYPKVAPPSSHISAISQPLNIQSVNQQVNVHPISQSFEPIRLNNYNSIPIDQCGANVDIVSIPLASSSFQEPMNLGYGNAYGNQHPDIVQMSNGTLIFPQEVNSQGIPAMSNVPVITNGFPQIYSPTIDLNQNSQFSYVGSITITNSASMSLSVNVPGQVIQNLPIFPPQIIPQQNLTFGQPQLMQVPLQLQSNTAVQMSTLNVQQLTLQSACANGGLAPVTFPQQTSIPGINSPVMFLEEAAVQSQMSAMSSFNQSSNLVLQMPIGIDDQSQTCYQPILSGGFVDPSNLTRTVPESFSETTICDSSLIPCDMQLFQTNLNNVHLSKPNIRPNAYEPSFQSTAHHQNNSHSTNTKPLSILPKTLIPVAQNVPNMPADNANNAEKPTLDITSDDSSQNGSNSGNLVDILKKAAQQMLSLSAELAAKKKVDKPAEEEKKTRFAHTRKVAARKAQQFKNRMLKEQGKTAAPKPTECLRLKISAIPTSQVQFSIPTAMPDPVQAEPASTNIPVSPQQFDISHSIVIDESSQHQHELNDSESYLLSLYNKKEKISLENQRPKDKPYILYEIKSEDGFCVQSHDINDAWQQVYDQLQDARIAFKKKQIMISQGDVDGLQMMGLHSKALTYLLEQLPGVENCTKYKFNFHKPAHVDEKWIVNPSGCARSEAFTIRQEYDMFSFLASEHRDRPVFYPISEEEEGAHKSSGRRTMSTDQPIAMRFRNLKTIARETVGVYRSSIHGRGLFCKRNIDPGELVIEYAGEVIRSVLTDKREQFYQSKGIGCYMFRIDDDEVVDATMHGNAARFINHSCEPNCFSKVITVDSKKHIVIFALRKILKGEELTYDYKFPFEDEKIPCSCNSRRCRKYLN